MSPFRVLLTKPITDKELEQFTVHVINKLEEKGIILYPSRAFENGFSNYLNKPDIRFSGEFYLDSSFKLKSLSSKECSSNQNEWTSEEITTIIQAVKSYI